MTGKTNTSTTKRKAARAVKMKPRGKAFEQGNRAALGHGRPSLFKEEYADMLLDYFKRLAANSIVESEDEHGGIKITARDFVSLEGFAASIDVSIQTLTSWAKSMNTDGSPKHLAFSEAYDKATTIQSALLIRGGMIGAYKGSFPQFAAKNTALQWRDVTEAKVEYRQAGDAAKGLAEITKKNEQDSLDMMAAVRQRNESTP